MFANSNSEPKPSAPPVANLEDRGVVSADETVPPKVNYQTNERKFTDIWWGVIYALSYIAFLACGIYLCSQAYPRYQTDEATGLRTISDHYMEEAQECCMDAGDDEVYGSVCWAMHDINRGGRFLQAGNSKFNGDEGMFDAFIEAPEIIVGLLGTTVGMAVLWFMLLRFFAKPIVFFVEVAKIAIFVTMGIRQEETETRVLCFFVAAGLILYAWWARKELMFAAEVIEHSTKAMKANPSVFLGGLFAKALFAGNAAIFLVFFSKSFEVTSIEQSTSCYSSYYGDDVCTKFCDFVTPAFVTRMDIFMSLIYLWTILLFDQIRLSIVATIVGSWHLHPGDQPGILVAFKNVAKSFGTLSVSSLITAIAEKLNRTAGENCWKSWISPFICITAPWHLLLCLIGTCFHTCIHMLTKFAIILHVFTGLGFLGSAKKVFKIMSRHFKGGFVTEASSKSVLTLGSYFFSVGIAMITWVWINDRFDCESMAGQSEGSTYFLLYVLIIVFNVWYPVVGIYILILANSFLQRWERNRLDSATDYSTDIDNFNHVWIPPLAAAFVGCISMILFKFLTGIFLDIIDTVFLCFAIEMDNNMEGTDEELKGLVKRLPGYIVAEDVQVLQGGTDVEAIPEAFVINTGNTQQSAKAF